MRILVIGRGYIGTALSAYDEFDVISHHQILSIPSLVGGYDAVVNAAGIVGHRKCEEAGYDAVVKANVRFPLGVQAICGNNDIPFFQLTTTGISNIQVAPTPDIVFASDMPVYPHNLYCASKILLESALQGKKAITLRIPWVLGKGVFESRVKNWDSVQDTYTSVLEIEYLHDTILGLVSERTVSGLFQLKSRDVYFPDFINKLLSSNLPTRTEYPSDMTAAIPIVASYQVDRNPICPVCYHRHSSQRSCLD